MDIISRPERSKSRAGAAAAASGIGSALFGLFLLACNILPVFAPPLACVTGDLANYGVEDPLQIISDCAGATIVAIIQAIEMELANPPGGVAGDGGAAAAPPAPTPSRVQYEAHLRRILERAKALQAQGVQ